MKIELDVHHRSDDFGAWVTVQSNNAAHAAMTKLQGTEAEEELRSAISAAVRKYLETAKAADGPVSLADAAVTPEFAAHSVPPGELD